MILYLICRVDSIGAKYSGSGDGRGEHILKGLHGELVDLGGLALESRHRLREEHRKLLLEGRIIECR